MKTREDKIFNAVGHAVMLVLSAAAVIPIILMVISSLTSNGALLRDGYSFSRKNGASMLTNGCSPPMAVWC